METAASTSVLYLFRYTNSPAGKRGCGFAVLNVQDLWCKAPPAILRLRLFCKLPPRPDGLSVAWTPLLPDPAPADTHSTQRGPAF